MSNELWLCIVLFLTVALGTLGFYELGSVRKRMNGLKRKLDELHTEEAKASRGMYHRLTLRFKQTDYGRSLEDRLTASNVMRSPLDWVLILFVLWAVLSILVERMMGLGVPYNLLAAYFVTNWGSKQWLKSRSSKFSQLINRQLPEVCRMMSSCIRAGMSVQQGIDIVAKELKPPAGLLFQTMSRELKMGTTLHLVLERVHERFTSKDIRLLTQTIIVQRQAGGNLGQALDHLAKTLEERERMNKEISNQTAESRYIALTLALMPVFLIVVFNMVFKGFIMPIFTVPGMVLVAVVLLLMTVGFLMIRKVSNIKA